MTEVIVKRLGGGVFVGTDSTKHSVVLDRKDKDNGVRKKPSELLLAALASYCAIDVSSILTKNRILLDELEIAVMGKQNPELPWQFENIKLIYRTLGKGLSDSVCSRAIDRSESKYCSVAVSLRTEVLIDSYVVILDD